jgi:AraC-like DNA-binding protein
MSYREFAPPAQLATHVACVWTREGPAERVLPDGCADLVWTGSRLIVAGPATRAVEPSVSASEPKIGVRFRVGAIGAALGVPAAELQDLSPDLDLVWPRATDLAERLGAAAGLGARARLLLEAVSERMVAAPDPDPLVRAAVARLRRPRAEIRALGPWLGLSERQLRRRFEAAVGYSPRSLARILRLQRFLDLARTGAGLARLAADAGYADQPHLTRDCRALTGLPAAQLLRAGAIPAGERLALAPARA